MRIATLILTLLFCVTAQAQSRIDELVENLSTSGHTTFTSIVTRNKVTRKVEKVVKHAEVMGNASKFISAFEEECKKYDSLEKTEDGTKTVNITVDGKKEKRMYILQYKRNSKHNAVITIIINYK